MRDYFVTLPLVVMVCVLLAVSCTKVSYRSYKCDCVQNVAGAGVDNKEYGLQAVDRAEAMASCNDIEDRVNKENKAEGLEQVAVCTLK